MSNDYCQRMLAISDELRAQGVSRYSSAPPIYRLAWKLGLRIRPPFYQSFATIALGMGAWFVLIWGPMMWFLVWRSEGRSALGVLVPTLTGGVIFGLIVAALTRRTASRLRLPSLS